jgi:hypothetical protein
VGGGVGWRVGVVVMVRSAVVGVGAAVAVGSLGRWQPATARTTRPRARGAMVRIGHMATSLVLPSTIALVITALAPIGLDLATGWSLLGHGCHLRLGLGAGRFIPR